MSDKHMFFGRDEQIEQIVKIVKTPDGKMNYHRAVAMYGQTRTGKSSLLLHLKNRLLEEYGDDILIWDLGNLGDKDVSAAFTSNFIYSMLRAAKRTIVENESIREKVGRSNLEFLLLDVRRHRESAQTLFGEFMADLNAVLEAEGKIVVLIVDEFSYLHEYIKDGKLPEEFMQFWKAMMQKNCMFSILAGQDDMPEFIRKYPNDFGSMEMIKLNYLAEKDAKKLIEQPLEDHNHRGKLFRDDGGVDELYQLTAGSAYLTIILCSQLVIYVNEKGAFIITKGIINDFIATRALCRNSFLGDEVFEPQIQERGHPEYTEINAEILLSVARLSQTGGYARLKDIACGTMSTEEIHFYLDRLVDRNVLVREGRDGYSIYVKLLEKWLIHTKGV